MKTRKQEQTSDRVIKKLHKLGFTKVTEVKDADEPIWVSVTKADSATGRKKDPADCALARACVREKKADGAVINVGVSYIIKGAVAERYNTSEGVGREITSFDRNAGFEPGEDYLLSAPSPSSRLDAKRRGDGSSGKRTGKSPRPTVHRHHTENIRVGKANPKKKIT